MAIAYAGGTNVYASINGSAPNALIDDIRAKLLTAGWSDAGSDKAYSVLTFTGAPSNGQTIIIDGTTYTFKTTLANAYDVKIGGTAAACASNLYDAINDNSANEGTTYGTGTAAHPTCEAVDPAGGAALTVQYKTGGTSGNGVAFTESLSNATASSATLIYGGWWLNSAVTPDGLSMQVRMQYYSSTRVDFYACPQNDYTVISSHTGTNSPYLYLLTSATRVFRIIANRYQAVIFLPGVSSGEGTQISWGVPYLPDNLKPYAIVSATNASPIVIETASAHGRATGDTVFVANCTGNTAANGEHTVTYIDATHLSLDGTTGNGVYNANSGSMAGPSQVAREIWVSAASFSAGTPAGLFRYTMAPASGSNEAVYILLNQYHWDAAWSPGVGMPSLFLPTYGVTFQNSQSIFAEPLLQFGIAYNAVAEIRGQLWDAIVVNRSFPMDLEPPNFDGHSWIQLCREAAANGGIFFVTGAE